MSLPPSEPPEGDKPGSRHRRRRRRRRGGGQANGTPRKGPAQAPKGQIHPPKTAPEAAGNAPQPKERRKRRRHKRSSGGASASKTGARALPGVGAPPRKGKTPEKAPERRPRRRLRVVAAVIRRGDEILVSLRHPKHARPSQWEFPGGKLEKGESERQALVREIREELGVRCEVGALVTRVVHPYPDTDVEIAFYETRIVEGVPAPLEMAEIRWVHRRDLESMDFLEADRGFVGQLARGEK